jgi:Endosomal/lysosomal potassium channel TMEM175
MGDDTEIQAGRTPERDAQARGLLERTHDPARVLAPSDGVFAVVITLLVLEIHVPELTQGHSLAEALAEVRPSFNAFQDAGDRGWPAAPHQAALATALATPRLRRLPALVTEDRFGRAGSRQCQTALAVHTVEWIHGGLRRRCRGPSSRPREGPVPGRRPGRSAPPGAPAPGRHR